MVRRTRKIKRSKNKKGGQSKFWAKATQGAGDIKTGFFTAVAKGKEVGAGAQQGMKDFNEARKAQYQSKVGATGGDGGRYSPVFEKMMKKKLALPASQVAFQRAARDKEASTDYANPNPFLSPMKRKRSSIIGGLFGKNPKALPKQRRSPILPGQDPFARKNPIKSKPKSKKSDALGRVSLETAQFMAHAGGKRKTKKRRKKKKRKTKKRRRKRKTKKRRRR